MFACEGHCFSRSHTSIHIGSVYEKDTYFNMKWMIPHFHSFFYFRLCESDMYCEKLRWYRPRQLQTDPLLLLIRIGTRAFTLHLNLSIQIVFPFIFHQSFGQNLQRKENMGLKLYRWPRTVWTWGISMIFTFTVCNWFKCHYRKNHEILLN